MARGLIVVDPQHTHELVVPRRVMCAFFWVGITLLFTGIILTVTSKHEKPNRSNDILEKQKTKETVDNTSRGKSSKNLGEQKLRTYQSWGAVLMGLGFCLLLICMILCMHAYCVITIADEHGLLSQPMKFDNPPTPIIANGGTRIAAAPSPMMRRPVIVPPPDLHQLKLENELLQKKTNEKMAINNGGLNYASTAQTDQAKQKASVFSARVTELPPIIEDSDTPMCNGSPPQLSSSPFPMRNYVPGQTRPTIPRVVRPHPISITRMGVRPSYKPSPREEVVTSPPVTLPKERRGPTKSVAVIQSQMPMDSVTGETESPPLLHDTEQKPDLLEADAGESDISQPTIVVLSPEHGITESKVSIYDNVQYIHI